MAEPKMDSSQQDMKIFKVSLTVLMVLLLNNMVNCRFQGIWLRHAVSAYAPEAVYNIFMRSMFDQDVAKGKTHASSEYHTTGPVDSWR